VVVGPRRPRRRPGRVGPGFQGATAPSSESKPRGVPQGVVRPGVVVVAHQVHGGHRGGHARGVAVDPGRPQWPFGWSGRKAYPGRRIRRRGEDRLPSAGDTVRSKIGRPVFHCWGRAAPVAASGPPCRPGTEVEEVRDVDPAAVGRDGQGEDVAAGFRRRRVPFVPDRRAAGHPGSSAPVAASRRRAWVGPRRRPARRRSEHAAHVEPVTARAAPDTARTPGGTFGSTAPVARSIRASLAGPPADVVRSRRRRRAWCRRPTRPWPAGPSASGSRQEGCRSTSRAARWLRTALPGGGHVWRDAVESWPGGVEVVARACGRGRGQGGGRSRGPGGSSRGRVVVVLVVVEVVVGGEAEPGPIAEVPPSRRVPQRPAAPAPGRATVSAPRTLGRSPRGHVGSVAPGDTSRARGRPWAHRSTSAVTSRRWCPPARPPPARRRPSTTTSTTTTNGHDLNHRPGHDSDHRRTTTSTTARATTQPPPGPRPRPVPPDCGRRQGVRSATTCRPRRRPHTLPAVEPDADGPVQAMVVSADGTKLYVGGNFDHIGGRATAKLAGSTWATGAVDRRSNPACGRCPGAGLAGDGSTWARVQLRRRRPARGPTKPPPSTPRRRAAAWMPPPLGPGVTRRANGTATPTESGATSSPWPSRPTAAGSTSAATSSTSVAGPAWWSSTRHRPALPSSGRPAGRSST